MTRTRDGGRATVLTYRYVAVVRWPNGDQEEVEVDVSRPEAAGTARRLVNEVLARDYAPGGDIVRLERRYGFYM